MGQCVPFPQSEGVAPAKAGEAAEVGVVGVDLRLVLHGEGGDVCVRHKVCADACGGEITPEMGQVPRGRG